MSSRRALVAEDSVLVLMELEMTLADHGVDIVGPASTVDQAMALVRASLPDIAILDVNLDGAMVFPVADELICHGVPVVFTTGYSLDDRLLARYGDVPTIQKPYAPDVLMGAIEAAFDRARGGRPPRTESGA
jgi:DNA-binding response OmpR family regulator